MKTQVIDGRAVDERGTGADDTEAETGAIRDPRLAGRRLLAPGTRVDGFRVIRLVGQGGMGQVYLARDTRLGRKVALKLISPERVGSASARERFRREAEATARFSHPNIVTLYSVGEVAGTPYVALEYLEGQTLRERLAAETPSLHEALQIAVAIASALREAHRAGVLHRDLNPSNVVLPRDGRPRVVDFGLAKFLLESDPGEEEDLLVDRTSELATQGAVGTPSCMAPEQWRCEEPSPATDVWALGLILHQLVHNRHPYAGIDRSRLRLEVASDDPVPTSLSTRAVPPIVDDLIARCLSKSALDRPGADEAIAALEVALERRPSHGDDAEPPFRGLAPFTERDAAVFYGRDAEIAGFLERLREEPVLPLVGASGAGKSSFVQAGIVPRLREQGGWLFIQVRPGPRPFVALARGFIGSSERAAAAVGDGQAGSAARSAADAVTLGSELDAEPNRLSLWLRRLADAERARIFLYVDQLEELYTLVDDASVRARFMRAICAAADDRDDPIRVTFTLRDDFVARLADDRVARDVLGRVALLRSPGHDALREILTAPLEAVGYRYDDPTLVDEMVAAVSGTPAGLPLLQFTARQLWHRRDRQHRLLRRATYVELGGVVGALATHADAVLDGLARHQQRIARHLLLGLITPEGTRRVVPRRRLLEGFGDAGDSALRRLVEGRLVSVGRARAGDDDDDAEVELVHESLIVTWARLARWRDECREDLAFLDEIGRAADAWRRRGRPDHDLWRGRALTDAGRMIDRIAVAVPAVVRDFHAAGQRAARRIRRRRRLEVTLAIAILAAAAVASTVAALRVRREERVAHHRWAEAQREAARAAFSAGDPFQARARLRSSLEAEDSILTRGLWLSLTAEPVLWQEVLGPPPYGLAISTDGAQVAVVSMGGPIYVIDAVTRDARALRWSGDQVNEVAFSRDGARLAASSWGGDVIVWDLADGPARTLAGHDGPVVEIAFVGVGHQLATAGHDGEIRVWDAASGARVQTLRETGSIIDIAVSADGRFLAAARLDGQIGVWNLETGVKVRDLVGHDGLVRSVAFVPGGADSLLLVSGGWDSKLRLWELDSASRTARVVGSLRAPVSSLAVSPDGRLLIAGSMAGDIGVWELATGVELPALGRHEHAVWLAMSRDRLVSAEDGALRLWDLAAIAARTTSHGHGKAVLAVAFSDDGTDVISAGQDYQVRVWDRATGAERAVLRGHGDHVGRLTSLRGGEQVASASADGTVRLWTLTPPALDHVLSHDGERVMGLAASDDAVFSATSSGRIRAWDPATGALRQSMAVAGMPVLDALAVRPGGGAIAVGGGDPGGGGVIRTIRLVDLASGDSRVVRRSGAELHGIAFSPDGAHLASTDEAGEVRITDLATGTSRLIASGLRAYDVDYHPDGTRLAVAGADPIARIWPIDGGPPVVLDGHRGEINSIRFSGDGAEVATAADDGTVRLWSARSGAPVWRAPLVVSSTLEMFSHQGWTHLDLDAGPPPSPARWRDAVSVRARRAAIASDGASLCLHAFDGTLERWDLRHDVRRAAIAIGRPLTLEAVGDRCLALVDGEARLYANGVAVLTVPGATAVAADGDRILVATGSVVRELSATGAVEAEHRIEPGAVLVGRIAGALVIGRADGNIELRPPGSASPVVLEAAPHSAPVALRSGPSQTLAVGFASGAVGIWHVPTGARLYEARLHGPAVHLAVRGTVVYAVSELGDRTTIDLAALEQPYCALLGRVWAAVPVGGDGRHPRPQPPPRSHPCAR